MTRIEKARRKFEADQIAMCRALSNYRKLDRAKDKADDVYRKADRRADKSKAEYVDLLGKTDL